MTTEGLQASRLPTRWPHQKALEDPIGVIAAETREVKLGGMLSPTDCPVVTRGDHAQLPISHHLQFFANMRDTER